MNQPEKMIIYNMFPTLAGTTLEWEEHLKRASDMKFNWIFINPIQLTGKSGSLYSIKDYFSINPTFSDPKSKNTLSAQIKKVNKKAKKLGLNMMIDLVISHSAIDSDLIKKHPKWYSWDNKRVKNPFCYEEGEKVVWRDLAQFDYKHTKDRNGLFNFCCKVIFFFIELGFTGFRCDAAYQVPPNIWKGLIKKTKKDHPGTVFIAETLGCTADQTRKTAKSGFDYIFNSSKWWNYYGHWMMAQYNLTRDLTPSVSFPESHDTPRLFDELNGNVAGIKQRYLFSALFSSGVMMPIGYEFGFRKRLHVVETTKQNWEVPNVDITAFIKRVNRIKNKYKIFQEDAPTDILPYDNMNILILWKGSLTTNEEALIILNKDINNHQHFQSEKLSDFVQAGRPLVDVSPENPLYYIPQPFSYDLQPGQGLVFVTQRDG